MQETCEKKITDVEAIRCSEEFYSAASGEVCSVCKDHHEKIIAVEDGVIGPNLPQLDACSNAGYRWYFRPWGCRGLDRRAKELAQRSQSRAATVPGIRAGARRVMSGRIAAHRAPLLAQSINPARPRFPRHEDVQSYRPDLMFAIGARSVVARSPRVRLLAAAVL